MKILSWTIFLAISICIMGHAEDSAKIFSPSVSGDSLYQDYSRLVNQFYEVMQNNDLQKLTSILSVDYHVSNASEDRKSVV